MVHDELAARIEISSVELIRNIPTQRSKLFSLLRKCHKEVFHCGYLNNSMKKGYSIQNVGPEGVIRVFQGVLEDGGKFNVRVSSKTCIMFEYVLFRLALMPCGGSFVNL